MSSALAEDSAISTVMGIPIRILVCFIAVDLTPTSLRSVSASPNSERGRRLYSSARGEVHFLQVEALASGLVQRRLQRFGECLARQGRTGDNIDLGVLHLYRFLLKHGHGVGINALRCPPIRRVGQELDVGNSAALDGCPDLY